MIMKQYIHSKILHIFADLEVTSSTVVTESAKDDDSLTITMEQGCDVPDLWESKDDHYNYGNYETFQRMTLMMKRRRLITRSRQAVIIWVEIITM